MPETKKRSSILGTFSEDWAQAARRMCAAGC